MAYEFLLWSLLMFGCSMQILSATSTDDPYMSKEERETLKEEARDMFYHAYDAYMDNAYPADELMPLSCKGRYRGSEPNRGDIDSTLGNFSLTLVDTLDTLVVLGDLEEFENAVKLVARDVSFDTDVIVSLFETNIRMLGGLLSGHILAEYLQQRADIMPWYRGELLDLAKDLGYRFLPAFNTSTGIPYGRINLKYGMKGVPMEVSRETCTACAGSMILEMAALSRLTGESIFEEKAQKAMDVLWRMRHRGTDLMGSVLNVNSGDWVRRDSGVGAGIDSYYEYCLKAYILLGDEKYLGRFNKHYQAVMKYVSQGPMLLDVHMHRPNTNSKNFMDALLAFWPGLQVLKGDIKPAVETHEMLYQVMQRHNFIPEAFTTDFQVHWGHHPLRPEFLESTYFLYRATGDHYYLGVGRKVLKSLQTYARVPCGYAAVSDVRTNKHDDTMDSFVLSETFKYLFLLFAEPVDLVLDLDEFIFTTEGHLLPLTLASVRTNISSDFERDIIHVDELDRTCPNSLHLFPASVRQPLRNMVEDVCPRQTIKRRLSASQFQANNLEHLKILSDMGITTLTLADGRVQLLHTFSNAKTPQDSEEGLLFMQEMVELSKMQSQQAETKPQAVSFIKPKTYPPQRVTLPAGPAHFGPDVQSFDKVTGKVVFAYPSAACTDLLNADELAGTIAIVIRGDCMFIEKARRIQQAGALAGIVLDNVAGSSAATSPMFAMSGDGREVNDVTIPVVFLFSIEATELMKAIFAGNDDLTVTLGSFGPKEEIQLKAPTDLSMFERLKRSLILMQQVIPQTSANRGINSGIVVPESEHQEEPQHVVKFRHLRAEVMQDSLGGEVRITATSYAPVQASKRTEESSMLEKHWRQLKEIFVNQIYSGKQKTGLRIRTVVLINYYNWVLKEHGVVNLDMSVTPKVLWFLTELSEISPNPSITKIGQLMDLNKRKLLKQYLLTKMDTMILNFKNIATKLKKVRLGRPGIELLLQVCELRTMQLEIYSFLYPILLELFDSEDESINEHMELLQNVHNNAHFAHHEIVLDGLQKNLEKPEKSEASYYEILMLTDLQRNLKSLKEGQHLLQKINEYEERTVAEFITDSNESKTDIENKNLLTIPKKDKDLGVEKFEDFEYFILTEIEKAAENLDYSTLQKYKEISSISKDLLDSQSKAITKPGKFILQSISQNQSKDENQKTKVESSKRKVNNLLKFKEAVMQEAITKDTHDAKKEVSTSSNDNVSASIADSQITKGLSQNERSVLQETKSNIDNLQTSYENDLNIPKSSHQAVDKNLVRNDPLEEFKKPIWASEERKDSLKHQEEYTVKSKKDNTRIRKGKHIQDEL